ncbi:hypothetical protein PG995_008838 [Apiospora arundinis]|uniref:HET-domain-containing protein n=1 Tax=Apiospora arundinis TaxID=335852 RepID=A0ABR2JM77_9PEZI
MSGAAVTLWEAREPRLLNGLCQYCTRTFAFKYTAREAYDVPWNRTTRYPEFSELLSSGCPGCETISRGIRWHLREGDEQKNRDPLPEAWAGEVTIHRVAVHMNNPDRSLRPSARDNAPAQLHVFITLLETGGTLWGIPFRIYGNPDSHDRPESRIRGRVPSRTPLSPSNNIAIRGYLENCSKHHSACRPHQSGEVPSRLIDVEIGAEGVRLVESDGLPAGTRYAALSHVWGNPKMTAPFLVTKKDALSRFKDLIPFHDLPQSFQDAIKVTRALQLRYVWIDSLCIVQDSLDDWHAEAPRMAMIYSNAYVTIVATRAVSAHDGFLKRTPPEFPPARIPYCIPNEDGSLEAGFVYLQIRYGSFYYHEPTMDIEGTVWNSRGWTFQERILSRRLIHFTKDLVFIECWSRNWSEDDRLSVDFINRMPWIGCSTATEKYSLNPADVYTSWYMLVQAYTRRSLTKEHDKLPALAGVAQRVSQITGDTNVAGLWKGDFANGLLWHKLSPAKLQGSSTIPNKQQGPSWSWASLGGPVGWIGYRRNISTLTCFDILQMAPPLSLPYQPDSGRVKVRGLLVGSIRITPDAISKAAYIDSDYVGSAYMDENRPYDVSEGILAFPIVFWATESAGHCDFLLLKTITEKEAIYRRVGVLSSKSEYKRLRDDTYTGYPGSFLGGRLKRFPITSGLTTFEIA